MQATAAALCRVCPVRTACLIHGLVDQAGLFGMHGGIPEDEIQKARSQVRRGVMPSNPGVKIVLGDVGFRKVIRALDWEATQALR